MEYARHPDREALDHYLIEKDRAEQEEELDRHLIDAWRKENSPPVKIEEEE
ncbi:MAG: hypothetical protein JST40_07890 [Armatimonadetes bacterium]|nr:hypothetical protein [Armatimonadota bacterium]